MDVQPAYASIPTGEHSMTKRGVRTWLLLGIASTCAACGARTIDEGDGSGPSYQQAPADTRTQIAQQDPDIARPEGPQSDINPPPESRPPRGVQPQPPPQPPKTPPPPTAILTPGPPPDDLIPMPPVPTVVDIDTTAPPPRDGLCETPLWLEFSQTDTGAHTDFLAATSDQHDWCGRGPEMVFIWTASQTGRYSFDTVGSDFDATLAVLVDQGNACGPLLQCDDDSAGHRDPLQSYVELYADAGTSYLVVVEGYRPQDYGEFTINAQFLPEDELECEVRELVSEAAVSVSGNFDADAVSTDTASQCNSGDRAVIFRYTAPADALYTFDTHGSSFDTVLVIGQSCAASSWGCNDDALDGVTSSVRQSLRAGQRVTIQLSAYGSVAAEPMPATQDGGAALPVTTPVEAGTSSPVTEPDEADEPNYTLNVSYINTLVK